MNKSINDLCFVISGGTPKTSNPSYWNGHIPWLSIKDFISTNRYVYTAEKTVTKLGLSNSAANLLQVNDIIISARGTVGKLAIVSNPMAFNQSCYGIRTKDPKILNQIYLYYWLLSHTQDIQIGTHGAVFDTITRNDFDRLIMDVPAIQSQLHIVNTLGSVDDLIENLQNQTRKIITIGELLLQQNSINESIIKYADILLGGTPSRKHPEYWNGSIKWINSGAITGTPSIQKESEFITLDGVNNSATKCANEGDSVLSIIEPSKNKVAIVLDDNVYFNQSVICLHSKNKNLQGLIYFSSRLLIDRIKGYATGAAQQSLNKDIFEKEDILVPPRHIVYKLNNFLLNIVNNEKQIRKLKFIKEKLLEKYF